MNRVQVLQEIRLMQFSEVYEWWQVQRVTQEEAAQLLEICERTFRRYSRKHEIEGREGLYDRQLVSCLDN